MEEDQGHDILKFSLSISTDRDHFLRRQCPSCGRDFKTQADEADMAWLIAPQISRLCLEIGEKDELKQDDQNFLYCPYCEDRIETNDTLTEEALRYIERQIMREYVLPMAHKAFSGSEDNGRSSGDFLSISIRYEKGILPPRPIHGPEPADMIEVEFLCCGKKAKVSERWLSIGKCIFCGTGIELT